MTIGIDYTAAARQGAGIGRYARELVGALLRLDEAHDYVLFAAAGGLPDDEWRSGLASERVRLRTVPLSDDWLARIWHRLRLPIPVEAITGPLDLFYSPDFVLPPTRRSTQTLLTIHDLSFLHYPEAFIPSLRQYLERVVPRSVARADRILADSASTRRDLIQHLGTPPEKVDVLYSGVDPRFRPEPAPGERQRLEARYGLGQRPYALSVGTLQPRKNYARLIRAFGQVDRDDLDLAIAGGRGWLYEPILAEAEKQKERVRLLGYVDDDDLPALYRQAALFAFPSLYEGFGLPVLEAMACGTPVVCSNTSSLPEVAGQAALTVDPLDTAALAEAMARVLTKPELRQAMIDGGARQAAKFTWVSAARRLLDTFEALGAPSD